MKPLRLRLWAWRARREIRRLHREADRLEAHTAMIAGQVVTMRSGQAPAPVSTPASRWELAAVGLAAFVVAVIVIRPPVIGPAVGWVAAYLGFVAVCLRVAWWSLQELRRPPDPPRHPH